MSVAFLDGRIGFGRVGGAPGRHPIEAGAALRDTAPLPFAAPVRPLAAAFRAGGEGGPGLFRTVTRPGHPPAPKPRWAP